MTEDYQSHVSGIVDTIRDIAGRQARGAVDIDCDNAFPGSVGASSRHDDEMEESIANVEKLTADLVALIKAVITDGQGGKTTQKL